MAFPNYPLPSSPSTDTAGAYCSPTILLRSGIGPQTELAELDIPCKLDLPGVGKNFQDHLVTFVPYEVTTPNLTHDSQIHHPGGLETSLTRYATDRSGVFASFPFGVFAYTRLDEQLKSSPLWEHPIPNAISDTTTRDAASLLPSQPHIELMHTELYSGHIHGQHSLIASTDPYPRHAFEMMTLLFAQQSRGTVSLSSRDPFAPPKIDPRYLEDPLDLLILAEGCKFAHELVTKSSALAPHLKKHGFLPVLNGKYAELWDGQASWDDYVREHTATAHHPAGTCRMGRVQTSPGNNGVQEERAAREEGIVVDEQLRVLGVDGLRVADCSVVPKLHGGHTQMVAYAIGERAAEILIERWRCE